MCSRIITNLYQKLLQMNSMRELPPEYLEQCPLIDGKYRVVFKLGSGRFSKVKMGINVVTNQRVAIKVMNQQIEEPQAERGYEGEVLKQFLDEVRMAHEARHRNIVQIIDFNVGGVYRTPDGKVQRILYYVMKIEEYGELFRLIGQTEQFSERTARHIFKQLLSALRHTHGRRVAHCDLKSENILLDSKFNVKLVDFGSARYATDELGQPISYFVCDGVGSLKCNAPQITNASGKGEYNAQEIDVFAAGCFLFELVMKTEPFKSSDIKDQHYSKLANCQQHQFWDIFSGKPTPTAPFKDLIESMLNPDPKERPSLTEVAKHPWLCGESPSREEYRKEMNTRVKKVMVKIRKEQEAEIKQALFREKGKKEQVAHEYFPIPIPREQEEQIVLLRSLVNSDDRSSSHSEGSGREENEEEKGHSLKANLRKQKSERAPQEETSVRE